MELKVLLFAQARQIADSDVVAVSVGDGATVADLKTALAERFPDLASLLSRSNFAIDQKYAVDEDLVDQDMEIAMIPPVSGG